MPHASMSRNLNQSVFSFIIATIFSLLLIPIFSTDVLILAIFEVPLAFLVALITVTECVYHYKDEVSLDTTFNMLKSLLKSLGISIPVVLFYSMIIVILHETIDNFQATLESLFNSFQGLRPIIAIPLICFIPVFIMIFVMPILLYGYGKVHVLLFTDKETKSARLSKADIEEKELEKKVFQTMDELDNFAFQIQQYLLELQGLPKQINEVEDYKSFKALNMRLTMMKDYIESISLEDDKETKKILTEEDVKLKLKEVEMQKKTAVDLVKQNIKKLYNEKKEFELDPDEEIEEEEETVEEEIVEETIEEVKEDSISEEKAEIEPEVSPEDQIDEEKEEELQDPSEIIKEDLSEEK
ncbi:MAG: hypothetical protein GOP50_03570 [Candidatus Heimdallarchaeota archaeon]|nr:hypothetical protein [Candidatus Heimdallarchaeota archaeon]